MKKLFVLGALALTLASCRGSTTVQFMVEFDATGPVKRWETLQAAIGRVVEGRVEAKLKKVLAQKLTSEKESPTATLTVTVSDAEAAKLLAENLTEPFTMEILKEVEKGQGDIVNDKFGEFKETGITTKHFDWVAAGTETTGSGTGMGVVEIQFTEEGQEALKTMFSENAGAVIGIFVRGQLMSKKLIEPKDATMTSILVEGIPNPTLASSFADDVNVGLHVTFTPIP